MEVIYEVTKFDSIGNLIDVDHILASSVADAYYQAVNLGEEVSADKIIFGPYEETWRIKITKRNKNLLTNPPKAFKIHAYGGSQN